MSLFSQDLDKGGVLRDVVSIRDIRYPSGKSLATPCIRARDTTQSSDDDYNGCSSDLFLPNFSEFDTESDWILTPQGFNCNLGFIKYRHLFIKEITDCLEDIDSAKSIYINPDLSLPILLENSILKGNIETLFIPFASSNIYTFQKPRDERYIYDYQWWKLVETSINDGLSKCIDPLWKHQIFVRMFGYTTFRCSFYVTIKLFGHRVYGDIFWPVREPAWDDDQSIQLFRTIDPKWPSVIKQEVGSPISISTRVDMEYIGALDSKEQEEF